jgi:cytochrome P450
MAKPYEYKKPSILRRALMRYMKSGLIPAEGERHRVQRKVVQKLFGGNSLRVYAGLIQHKADQASTTTRLARRRQAEDCCGRLPWGKAEMTRWRERI